nr:MAG TPA: hypothetical protein [Caudoviricetes sp.]
MGFDAAVLLIFTFESCVYQLYAQTPLLSENATVKTLDRASGYVKPEPPIPPCLFTYCEPYSAAVVYCDR